MQSPTVPGGYAPGRPGQAAPRDGVGPEALAFIIEMGICPGGSCLRSRRSCDPRCPALRAWVEDVSGG
jgi:hypothetical protein